jgi:uncharacterized protein
MDQETIARISLRFRLKGSDMGPDVVDGRIFLRGERTWLLEGEPPDISAAQTALGRLSTRLTSGLLEVNFGNTVGFVRLPGLDAVEIVSGKWGGAQFEQMLADLMLVASGLPFSASASGTLPYDRTAAEIDQVLYHAFVYLRYILSDRAELDERLLPPLKLIVQEPHRVLQRTRERLPLERAYRMSTAGLTRLATGQEELVKVRHGPYSSSRLARALKDHLPPSVEHVRIDPTCDTPENRFVKTFLDQALAIVRRVHDLAVADGGVPAALAENLRAECDEMMRSLGAIRHHAMWRDVGPMTHVPAGSTILQRRAGYRDIYRHFGRLRNAMRIPLEVQTLRRLLEIRDIAELYELWCYFSLVRIVSVELGTPSTADAPVAEDLKLAIQRDFTVSWTDRITLFYNRGYSRSLSQDRQSYSVPLRPDIALEVASGPNRGLHLLDAKFKLDSVSSWEPDQETDERFGIFKRADLYKMHTYRDAIPRARSVWVLYPGTETRFYAAGIPILESLARLRRAEFNGVGAVPFVPGAADHRQSEIGRLVRLLIAHD